MGLKAKREGKPLWLLLGEMTPEEIVDLRYLSGALTPEKALQILNRLVDLVDRGIGDGHARLLLDIGCLGD